MPSTATTRKSRRAGGAPVVQEDAGSRDGTTSASVLDKAYAAGTRVGYARVSRQDQSLARQEDLLAEDGCAKIFTDQVSGVTTTRPGLDACLAYLRRGDTLVVQELSRAGRSLRHLLELVDDLDSREIGFRVLNLGIDTRTSTGRLVISVLGACAALERDLIRERTQTGLAAARARGRVGGRPRALTEEQQALVREWHADGKSQVTIARLLGTSRATVQRTLMAAAVEAVS